MFKWLRKKSRNESTAMQAGPPPLPPEADEEPVVPEVTAEALRARLESGEAPLLLDIREMYEWRQVHFPADRGWIVRHIPMSLLPDSIGDLPRSQELVVICAHGSRSYDVAHYLNEQGFEAFSLRGGITRWAAAGGPTTREGSA